MNERDPVPTCRGLPPDLVWKIAPSPAIPVAIPTWRNVLLIPDAIPARRGSTTLTAVEASGALTSPMPMPPTMKPGSRSSSATTA